MNDAGKMLMVLGAVVVIVGALVWGVGRLGFRGMPGDVRYESGNVRFYFPIVTCIVLSLVLTLAMWLWRWISGR
jgi:hypothetical protein